MNIEDIAFKMKLLCKEMNSYSNIRADGNLGMAMISGALDTIGVEFHIYNDNERQKLALERDKLFLERQKFEYMKLQDLEKKQEEKINNPIKKLKMGVKI